MQGRFELNRVKHWSLPEHQAIQNNPQWDIDTFLKFGGYPAPLQKLVGQLQDAGNSTTIKGYLEILEAGFIVKTLSKYPPRVLTTKNSSPKIIPLCPALIHAFENPARVSTDPEWKGRVFEAAIGARLLEHFDKIFYWRDGDKEIDFVVEHDGCPIGIEVKSGRKKKAAGAQAFKKQFPNSKVLTIDFDIGSKLLKDNLTEEVIKNI